MKEFRPGVPKKEFRPARYYGDFVDEYIHEREVKALCGLDRPIAPPDILRMLARRASELEGRGYPGEWIEKELQKIVEVL